APGRRPCNAVTPASGTAAACSNETFTGFATSIDGVVQTYSASVPRPQPNTASPALNSVTFFPTDATSPARSQPGVGFFGLRAPASRRIGNGVARTGGQSRALSGAAAPRPRTAVCAGRGGPA